MNKNIFQSFDPKQAFKAWLVATIALWTVPWLVKNIPDASTTEINLWIAGGVGLGVDFIYYLIFVKPKDKDGDGQIDPDSTSEQDA